MLQYWIKGVFAESSGEVANYDQRLNPLLDPPSFQSTMEADIGQRCHHIFAALPTEKTFTKQTTVCLGIL